MPKSTGIRVPKFITLNQRELTILLHVDRHAPTLQVYLLLLGISDFKTGHVLTSYAYLEDMCRPPGREKGGRRGGLSNDQLQRLVRRLIEYGLVKRDPERNEAQGMLRLYVRALEKEAKKPKAN